MGPLKAGHLSQVPRQITKPSVDKYSKHHPSLAGIITLL